LFESFYKFYISKFPRKSNFQALAVKGRLLCHGKPYGNISVRLVDIDLESFPDKMDEMITADDGIFVLNGTETEILTIDPALQL
jgi:hypothetical protein